MISHEIRAAVPTRVGDRFGLHRLLTVQVGDGAGDPEQLKAATGSESALLDDPLPQHEPIGFELAVAAAMASGFAAMGCAQRGQQGIPL